MLPGRIRSSARPWCPAPPALRERLGPAVARRWRQGRGVLRRRVLQRQVAVARHGPQVLGDPLGEEAGSLHVVAPLLLRAAQPLHQLRPHFGDHVLVRQHLPDRLRARLSRSAAERRDAAGEPGDGRLLGAKRPGRSQEQAGGEKRGGDRERSDTSDHSDVSGSSVAPTRGRETAPFEWRAPGRPDRPAGWARARPGCRRRRRRSRTTAAPGARPSRAPAR